MWQLLLLLDSGAPAVGPIRRSEIPGGGQWGAPKGKGVKSEARIRTPVSSPFYLVSLWISLFEQIFPLRPTTWLVDKSVDLKVLGWAGWDPG